MKKLNISVLLFAVFLGCSEKKTEYLVKSINSGERCYVWYKNKCNIGDTIPIVDGCGSKVPMIIEKVISGETKKRLTTDDDSSNEDGKHKK